MSARVLRALVLATGLVVAAVPAPALAHPLGNFTVNTHAEVLVTPGQVRIAYVLDLAEIPTLQELPQVDASGDAEIEGWARQRAAALRAGLSLEVDGRSVRLETRSVSAGLRPGEAGLGVVRLEAIFTGSLPRSGRAVFRDRNGAGRLGWREIVVVGTDGIRVTNATVPAASASDRLRAYPDDLLSDPLHVTRASFSYAPGPSPASVDTTFAAAPPTAGGRSFDDRLADLLDRVGIAASLIAMAVAFGVGALHAAGPGHGKTLVAASLVGTAGRVRHAAVAALAVAAMHLTSTLALGVVILVVDASFATERLYPWLGIVAGACAALLGGTLLTRRLRRTGGRAHHLDHAHDHAHRHEASSAPGPLLGPRGLLSLALAGGILPSPSALVTLLAAASAGRVGLGLALVGAFSLGLALTLAGVGALALRARDLVSRRLAGRSVRIVGVGSAATVLMLGLAMAFRGMLAL